MLQRFFKASPIVKVLGHDIDKPKLTVAGWCLIFLYLALPFMLIGALFDFFIQLICSVIEVFYEQSLYFKIQILL